MYSSDNDSCGQNHDHVEHSMKTAVKLNVPLSPRRHLSDLLYVERYENGGGYILHAYANEIASLSPEDACLLAKKFFRSLFMERKKKCVTIPFSYFCIGVVHGAAKHIPELVNYIARHHPNIAVTTNSLDNKNASYTTTVKDFADNVFRTYCNGLYRHGPMHSISLVGVKGEEKGQFLGDILEMISRDPFLRLVLPWGILSTLSSMSPQNSDDGPILWVRPGEQAIPLHSPPKSRRRKAASFSLATFASSRISNPRHVLIPDRTPCHADHADDGLHRHTTAAIGLLKAVYPPSDPRSSNVREETTVPMGTSESIYTADAVSGRIIKDVVVFDPQHYWDLVERLGLDIMEPPASQCGNFWADDGELNLLRMEGFRYARLPLRDNDIYFLPRSVVHQFKTVSAGTSIAWHTRLKTYYPESATDDAPGSSVTPAFLQTSPSLSVAAEESAIRAAKAQARALKRSTSRAVSPIPGPEKISKEES